MYVLTEFARSKEEQKKTWLILAAEYKAVVSLLNALN